MSSSYDAYSVQSVPSSSAAPTNKKRWRDMGLSGAASSGLANLLRSAKKSTDSLRSTASATSNRARSVKSFHSTSSEKKDFRLSMNKDLPPNPPNLTQRPDLQSRTSESSSAASRIIHDVPEEPPLEFYEMPPEAELDSNVKIARNNVQKSVDSGFHTPTRLSSSQDANTIDREQNNTTPTNESELRKREKISSKKPTITSRSASLNSIAQNMTPSRSLSYDADGTESQVNATSIAGWTTEHEGNVQEESGTKTPTNEDNQNKPLYEGNNESLHRLSSSAKSIARKSLTRIRRKSNASTSQDAAKAASAAVAANTDQPMPTSASNNVAAAAAKIAVGAGTQWAGNKNSGGDGNTIAQLYAVFGLPKDPSVWTIAEEDCVLGVHHAEGAIDRFWRPEVLGCSICPSPSEVLGKTQASSSSIDNETAASKWEGRSGDKEENTKKSQSPKFIEMNDGRGATEKAETARVLSKALKLSFTREVEIVAEQGHYPPKATSHTFSFSVPTIPASGESYERSGDGRKVAMATGVSVGMTQAANGVGEGYGLTAQRRGPNNAYGTNNEEGPRLATFYGVALTVWSAADEKRAKVIKKELQKAKKQNGTSLSKTESNDQDSGLAATRSSSDSVYFMPYAICIVSRFPLYNLLGDWNKMAWHKYSRNIEMHNQLMSTILRHPAPRLGEEISVGSPEKDLSFHCTFPGAVEWGTGMIGIDFTMWPLFNTLSLDNILTICEIALGHNGRILFISRHPALLGMAVETLRYIVEQNGWRGVVHQICHARDVRIYLEDPGSWIIGINAELRGLVHPPAQVCTVDLDLNRIACNSPPLNAISTKGSRERRKKRLQQAIQIGSFDYRPPREFVDAYPGGRFRPLSRMITRDLNSAYEQLPSPQWWNQVTIIQTFDTALREDQRSSLFKRMLKPRRNTVVASDAEIAAIMALRKRASTFVDARDGLENKIGRLNKRLAFLMSESEMWRAQFGKIQVLVDRLTKEANDLRSKVDKERRESKRLSSRLAQRDIEHVQIQLQLKDTEQAREEALGELLRMKSAMESVEQEREAMMDEIRAVLSGGGNIDDVNLSVSRLDLPSFNVLSRSSSPTGSQVSMTPSQAAEYVLKARAVAEARISEGRPGRTASRTNSRLSSQQGHRRSMSQDRAEREGRSYAGSTNSHANHFPDEQMNYEIQQRTNIVTDQISRIQQQLESTLTNLEGRRSGTYERETNRRQRRGSNASIGSRYEYRSSVGHGMQTNGDENSMNGHMSEDGRSDIINYEKVESVQERPARGQRRRRSAAPPTASSQSLREAYASSNASHTSLNLQPPALTPKSSSRPRISSINSANGVIGSVKKVQSPITSIRSPEAEVIPGPVAESISGDSTLIAPNVTTDSATLDGIKNNLNDSNPLLVTSVFSQEDMMNGVQAQPMLSVLNNSKANNETSESTAVEEIEAPIESQNQDAVQEVSTPFGVTASVESASTIADKNNFNYSSPLFSMALERSDRKTSQDESRKTASGGTSPTLATGASFGTDADSLMTKNGWTVDTGNVKNVDELGGTNGDAITTST